MRLALAVLAYLCGAGALIATAVAGYQVMVPADRTAVTTASTLLPPRAEPKRVEPIRPVNEPLQNPTQKYELSSVPLSATAAYNKKKAQGKSGHRTVHRNTTPKISSEAANAYGSAQSYAPRPRRPGDWTIY
jgi:hypothetical protein